MVTDKMDKCVLHYDSLDKHEKLICLSSRKALLTIFEATRVSFFTSLVLECAFIWFDAQHLTYKSSAQDCISSFLTGVVILYIASIAALTTINTYKPMEISINRSPQL